MISRLIWIVVAIVLATLQATRGAWVESAGLLGIAAGLFILRTRAGRPSTPWLAGAAFSVTAVAVIVVALRMRG